MKVNHMRTNAIICEIRNAVEFVPHVPRWLTAEFAREVNAKIIQKATLDYPDKNLNIWERNTPRPEIVLCHYKDDPKHFKVFKYLNDIEFEQFKPTNLSYYGISRSVTLVPTPEGLERARFRSQNNGRWVVWTKNTNKPAGSGASESEARQQAKDAGFDSSNLVAEFVYLNLF